MTVAETVGGQTSLYAVFFNNSKTVIHCSM